MVEVAAVVAVDWGVCRVSVVEAVDWGVCRVLVGLVGSVVKKEEKKGRWSGGCAFLAGLGK